MYVHLEGPASVSIPYLKPSAMLQKLLVSYPWVLLGGHEPHQSGETLRAFWKAYEKDHPQHEVFQRGVDLGTVVPLTLHGDGGRTQKRQPLEIFSMQATLGLETARGKRKWCHCPSSEAFAGDEPSNPMSQCLNSKFNSYLTHYLIFAFPSKAYRDQVSNLLQGIIEHVSRDLGAVCKDGLLSASGQRFYFACVGFRLDMEWMQKVGSLCRSYMNVGSKTMKACCHECDAGQPNVNFEDVGGDAAWVATRWNTLPWRTPPPWRHVPFEVARPAKFLRRDPLHIIRLGIGRNWLASSILLLIHMG